MSDIIQVFDPKAPLLRAITLEGVTLDRALVKEFGRAATDVRAAWHDDIRHDMTQLLSDANTNVNAEYLKDLWHREIAAYGKTSQIGQEMREYVKNHPYHIFATVRAGYVPPPYDIVIKNEAIGPLRYQETHVFGVFEPDTSPLNEGYGGVSRENLNKTGIYSDEFLAEAKARGLDEVSAKAELAKRYQANLFEDSVMFYTLKQHWDFTAKGNASSFAQVEDAIRQKHHMNMMYDVRERFDNLGFKTGEGFRRAISGLMIRSFPHAENPNPAMIARARGLAV